MLRHAGRPHRKGDHAHGDSAVRHRPPPARTSYGHGTAPWSETGCLEVEEDWWIALSHTPYVDYNLALLHGPTSGGAVSHVLGAIGRARTPGMVMLAGAGLGAAEELRDAGWVCTGTQPFMARTTGEAVEDASVRPLRTDDLAEAQALAGSAFGVPEEVGAIVYSERALARPDTRAWGLYDDGGVGAGDRATAPARRPRPASAPGLQLLPPPPRWPPVALCTASPAGERLCLEEGYTTLEHWQAWSRARWVLR